MKKVILSIILSIALMGIVIGYKPAATMGVYFDCSAVSDVPQEECEALISLYVNTAGVGWTNQDNWLRTQPIDTKVGDWYGVTVSSGHVTSLELPENNLVGPISQNLENLSNLQVLRLDHNQLSSSIPESIGNLSNLRRLILNHNQLNGSLPDSLGNLSNITDIFMDHNELTGSIPASLGNLSHLQKLYLSENQLTSNIPASLGNLSILRELKLDQNQLSGSIPESLGNLTNLQYLHLNNNQLTDNIPESLGNLGNLSSLRLYNNQLSGSIPDSLGNLSNLTWFYLNANQLSGSIPHSLGNLSKVHYFTLRNNNLSGNIPDSLGNLSNVTRLSLGNNQLNGTIPETLGNLNNLKYLSLYDNQLSDTIPDSLGNLSNLISLKIDHNRILGTIPDSLGNLSNLNYLYLNDNQLRDDVPASFTNLVNLCVPGQGNCTDYGLNLAYNRLNVPAPEPLAGFLAVKDPDWHLTQRTTIFEDVPETHWAHDYIQTLYYAGVTSGCHQSPPMYCPEQPVTRAEMAKFLLKSVYRISYIAPPVGTSTGFNDVPIDYWAASWIKQLATDGITSGCGGGNYCPNDNVTRAEMAKFLLTAKNGAGYTPPPVDGGTGFNDVPPSYWAAAWIKQLATRGITHGCGGGNYCPNDNVTRAEMAKFLTFSFYIQFGP